jgi:hypothetical protein
MISTKLVKRGLVGRYVEMLFGRKTDVEMSIVELDVHYSEKDEAKRLGAKWNPERKTWYVPSGMDSQPFERWIPLPPSGHEDQSPSQMIHAPVWLLISYERCYRCRMDSAVFALSADKFVDIEFGEDHEVYFQQIDAEQHGHISFYNLERLDDRIATLLARDAPKFRLNFSQSQSKRVYMNHCQHCDAKLGDFFLHCELGGAFCPDSFDPIQDLDRMKTLLIAQGEYKIKGCFGLIGHVYK